MTIVIYNCVMTTMMCDKSNRDFFVTGYEVKFNVCLQRFKYPMKIITNFMNMTYLIKSSMMNLSNIYIK